uniref:Uncharacterized protein n=1 Tax=Manihot esculenta TaxID=3983 RepID=A0A2C9V248_MANES
MHIRYQQKIEPKGERQKKKKERKQTTKHQADIKEFLFKETRICNPQYKILHTPIQKGRRSPRAPVSAWNEEDVPRPDGTGSDRLQ